MVTPIHPSWQPGQYVTYLQERENGKFIALDLRIRDKDKKCGWILSSDIKTRSGECTIWLAASWKNEPDMLPVRVDYVRGVELSDIAEDLHAVADHPEVMTSLPVNLLLPRIQPELEDMFRTEPHCVDYPCGIQTAYDVDFADKRHHVNPAVPVTGVVSLTGGDGSVKTTLTSFGWGNADRPKSAEYDDYIDFGRMEKVEHERFTLTYPATWFLRGLQEEKPDLEISALSAQLGGKNSAVVLSTHLMRGSRVRLKEERKSAVARINGLCDSQINDMRIHGSLMPELAGNSSGGVFEIDSPNEAGMISSGVFFDSRTHILAQVSINGFISKGNPRREFDIAEMARVFPEILSSFSFLPY